MQKTKNYVIQYGISYVAKTAIGHTVC